MKYRQLINEALVHDTVLENSDAHKEKVIKWINRLKRIVRKEREKTAEMFKVYKDYVNGSATPEEMEAANKQFRNLLKIAGLTSLTLLPGSVVTIPIVVKLAKKYNINLLPDLAEDTVLEASYAGNIGAMEMFKFYAVATDEQKDELNQRIAAGEKQKAWALIQQVTGVKLQGSEFNESQVDEDWRKYAVAAGMGAIAASSGTAVYDKMTSRDKVDSSHTVQSTIKKPEIPQALPAKKTSDVELAKDSSSQYAISLYGNKNENILIAAAISQGIKGVELAAFLAQCAHETGGYVHLVELGDDRYFDKYDAVLKKQGSKTVNVNPKAVELGNNQPGDGPRFKGRGFIQITGRANYRAAGEELGIPLEKKPKLAERPDVAADIAVWYWKTKVRPRVTNFSNVKAVTVPINGGKKGIESRAEKFDKYLTKVKSVSPKLKESASDGSTSAGNIATVVSPHISPGSARGKKSYIGSPGKSGTKCPPQVKPKMQTPSDNALDMNVSLFGGVIKR